MCLQVRKGLGIPVLALLPSVRHLGVNNRWWLTSWDLSACESAVHLQCAPFPSHPHNSKSFQNIYLFKHKLHSRAAQHSQKCTLCFCWAFLQKISKYLDNRPICKITRDLSCPLDSSVYWHTSVSMAPPVLQSKLTEKLDLWSSFFNPLLFQLVTASFHFLQNTFWTAFEAGGSNVKNDAESTGSIRRREVQRRSVLLNKCPDASGGGQAGGYKRQHHF